MSITPDDKQSLQRTCGSIAQGGTRTPENGHKIGEDHPSPSPEDRGRTRNRWSSGDLLRQQKGRS